MIFPCSRVNNFDSRISRYPFPLKISRKTFLFGMSFLQKTSLRRVSRVFLKILYQISLNFKDLLTMIFEKFIYSFFIFKF
ncbi:hypothetical protein BGX16_0761 [Hallerella succinigenes]|uniref:Uncharacterized protein n=1 Tax=Hallerella succinigenes TaxID=1896222 RepID=A0A2M9A532_9BACT|nr:hypothetical protein BGX16_0761 [Hallerella succinigenes]